MNNLSLYNKAYTGLFLLAFLFVVRIIMYAANFLPDWFYLNLFFWLCFNILLATLLGLGLVKSIYDLLQRKNFKQAVTCLLVCLLFFSAWSFIKYSQKSSCLQDSFPTGAGVYDLSSLECRAQKQCNNDPWYFVKGCPFFDQKNNTFGDIPVIPVVE